MPSKKLQILLAPIFSRIKDLAIALGLIEFALTVQANCDRYLKLQAAKLLLHLRADDITKFILNMTILM